MYYFQNNSIYIYVHKNRIINETFYFIPRITYIHFQYYNFLIHLKNQYLIIILKTYFFLYEQYIFLKLNLILELMNLENTFLFMLIYYCQIYDINY